MSQRWLPPLLIAGLGLLFFAPLVLHPTEVLYSDHSDLLAEHLPAKRFLVRSLHETGELPLWCPYSFSGTSFIHDIQAQIMYPPHWLLFLLPEEYVGAGLSWLIVMHVLLAGLGMYGYARLQGLNVSGALAAAIGYMFAGKWMLHLLGGGHYVTIGLAWLPLLLLFLDSAIQQRCAWRATAAGVVYGLMALGTQPQWTVYAGLFVAMWTLGTALESHGKTARALLIWLLCGAWTVGLAVGLAAVQLLPTLEAARWSTRAGGVAGSDALRGGIQSLLFLVGPSLRVTPPNLQWEDRGGFGLLWLSAAVAGVVLGSGRTRFQAGVAAILFLFAFGGSALVESLPGFNLFRQPSRMLLVATFPVALLAGRGVQALTDNASLVRTGEVGQRVFVRVSIAAFILVGGFAIRSCIQGEHLAFHAYWATLTATLPAAFWLLHHAARRWTRIAWVGLLLVDAWGLAWPLVDVKPQDAIYPSSRCVQYLVEQRDTANPGRVLDRDIWDSPPRGPLGRGEPLALVFGLEPVRGYNPLDSRLYRKYLQFIDGRDAPLRSMEDSLTFPILNNLDVRNKVLLDLLGVRFFVQPSDEPSPGPGWQAVEQDPDAVAYNFDSGMRPLGPYTIYRNMTAFERVFVVPQGRPLGEDDAYGALISTDFRHEVLLSDGTGAAYECSPIVAPMRYAAIRRYDPNRVEVDVEDGEAGYLVLADPWYPGWTCSVDGTPAPLYRADYLFRAVFVTPGLHHVEFTFLPDSYRYGKIVSVSALSLAAAVFLLALVRRAFQKPPSISSAAPKSLSVAWDS